jgi:adenylate kinase
MPKKLILLIGAPGSGKTTDAEAIAKNHKEISSYSLGSLLSEEAKKDTKLGKISRDYMEKGDLVPTAIVIDTLCSAIQNSPTDVVLIDGFPRKNKQMKFFGDLVKDINRVDLMAVIEIRVSRETARRRVESSLKEYEKDAFSHAMDLYEETIKEIEEFYNHDGLLRVINGERKASEVIDDIDEFLQYKVALAPA